MKENFYCEQCAKEYETSLENIEYIKRLFPESLLFHDGSYRFKNGCFFKTLTQQRRKEKNSDTKHSCMDA